MSTTHRTGPKWTHKEDEILIDCIGYNPTNLKASFLAASVRLPIRTPAACSQRWYSTLAKREDIVAKVTVGRHVAVKNKIRLTPETEETHKVGLLRNAWLIILRALGVNQ